MLHPNALGFFFTKTWTKGYTYMVLPVSLDVWTYSKSYESFDNSDHFGDEWRAESETQQIQAMPGAL
jgi:hypothetical protein